MSELHLLRLLAYHHQQNNAAPKSQIVTLQKQNDFKSFAIKRSESEQAQSPEQRLFSDFVAVAEKRFAAAIVRSDPAAPVNFVEEPVHDHEQHHDGEKSGRSL